VVRKSGEKFAKSYMQNHGRKRKEKLIYTIFIHQTNAGTEKIL